MSISGTFLCSALEQFVTDDVPELVFKRLTISPTSGDACKSSLPLSSTLSFIVDASFACFLRRV